MCLVVVAKQSFWTEWPMFVPAQQIAGLAFESEHRNKIDDMILQLRD
jgi:hypothetical protein